MNKKLISMVLALLLMLTAAIVPALAAETADVIVTIADKDGNLAVTAEHVTVNDIDNDGVLTVNDALYCAHEAFYEGGATEGYATMSTQWGLSLNKLWGVSNGGSYGYYINNAMAWSMTDPVKTGDHLYAYIYTDLFDWTDAYSFFDADERTATADEAVPFSLSYIAFDENYLPYPAAASGAILTVNGEDTDVRTDENGDAELTFTKAGTYIVSAYIPKEYQTVTVTNPDGTKTERDRIISLNITHPVCKVTVTDSTAPQTLIGDADRSGSITIVDVTTIQRYLADLLDESEIDLEAADTFADGKVSIVDATRIQQYLAEICNIDGSKPYVG